MTSSSVSNLMTIINSGDWMIIDHQFQISPYFALSIVGKSTLTNTKTFFYKNSVSLTQLFIIIIAITRWKVLSKFQNYELAVEFYNLDWMIIVFLEKTWMQKYQNKIDCNTVGTKKTSMLFTEGSSFSILNKQ